MLVTQRGPISYKIRSYEGTKGKNIILNFLRKYDLLSNKHIPDDYKINDEETRLQVLAGIIDTDGYLSKGCNYDIIQKNERLLDDIIYLARSLGFYCQKTKCQKSCKVRGEIVVGTYYRTNIRGNIDKIPCKILRKQANPRTSKQNHLVSGFTIEQQEYGDYYGFTIDGDHRFLLGSFDVVRNSGKSSLIKALLHAKKHIIPVAIAMSGTEDSNHAIQEFMHNLFIFNEYDEEKLKDVVKRQKISREHVENPWCAVILDDVTDSPAVFRKPLQQGLYKKGRHYNFLYILALQYSLDVPPAVRSNTDFCFIFRDPLLKNRKTLYENYASVIPDFEMFCALMDQLTGDYQCLCIINSTTTNTWTDCVYYWKAPQIKDWKLGCPEYYQFAEARYNPDYHDTF